MATIQPKGEKMRQAVRWISENLQEEKHQPLTRLIEDAALRFNLSPVEEEFLLSFYQEGSDSNDE